MAKTKRRITRLNKNTLKNRATKKATRRLGRKRQKGGVPSSNFLTATYNQHERGYNDAARDAAAKKRRDNAPGVFSTLSSGISKLFSRKPK